MDTVVDDGVIYTAIYVLVYSWCIVVAGVSVCVCVCVCVSHLIRNYSRGKLISVW